MVERLSMLVTSRMWLIPATAALVRAELTDRVALVRMLDGPAAQSVARSSYDQS